MARAMHPDSAGSQFFIMVADAPHLDGQYAAFGKICEGLDIVNKIAECATDYMDKPLEPQVMKKVTVETFGVVIRNRKNANFTENIIKCIFVTFGRIYTIYKITNSLYKIL